MNEWPSTIEFPSRDTPREFNSLKKQLVSSELFLKQENFSFPGIKTESYRQLKKEEEEFPGFVTPIDELLHKFRNNGMRIHIGKSAKNPIIIPDGSTNVTSDSIFPADLLITESITGKLRELIRLDRILITTNSNKKTNSSEFVFLISHCLQ